MKEYKVEGRPLNKNAWWSIGNHFNNIEEAKERIAQEIKFDKFYKEKWEYRILVRDVSEWKPYEM